MQITLYKLALEEWSVTWSKNTFQKFVLEILYSTVYYQLCEAGTALLLFALFGLWLILAYEIAFFNISDNLQHIWIGGKKGCPQQIPYLRPSL